MFSCCIQKSSAQVSDVDSAFQVARTLAFSSEYTASITLCKLILKKSPTYQDVLVLMGRVYFWNKQTDSALITLEHAIRIKPYEEAYIALADIFRWEEQPAASAKTAEAGLASFPSSEALMIRKVKALYAIKDLNEAYLLSDSLAKKKNNPEMRQLAERIKSELAKNVVSISYDFDFFDKQFKEPWHLFSVSYGRQTHYLGRVIARVNAANRFATNAAQIEMDAYPSLGKKMYAYINAGYSEGFIFPNYRSGLSVYRNFPHAFEGELGIRLLYYSKATILYVASIGKYTGNLWLSFRPTFIASENGNRFSQSYAFITRYYMNTSFDYLALTIGYGISPDDRSKETLFQNPDLKSARIQLALQRLIRRTNVFSCSLGIARGEFIQGSKQTGNDFFAGVSYQKMF